MKEKSNVEKVYPLSPMQSGMLFHALRDEASHAYFESGIFHIEGEPDRELLTESFNHLIRRYDVLRTAVIYEKVQKPRQVVLRERKGDIPLKDISHLAPSDREARLQDFIREDRERGFDLKKDLLARLTLFKTDTAKYRLFWSWHHIIMDGWCLEIVFRDFITIYHMLSLGEEVRLPPAVPYRDYINWLEKQDNEENLGFWRRYLGDYEQPSEMPGKRSDALAERYSLQENRHRLDGQVTENIRQVTRRFKVTVNTLFQSLWGVLLQRYNNTGDVVYGSVVSGRSAEVEGIEDMVGLFINAVPVRITSTAETRFADLMLQVHSDAAAAKPYEYLPLAEIQALSPLKTNLIDHILIFENFPFEEIKEAGKDSSLGFSVTEMELMEQTNYDFYLTVEPGEALDITFSYNTEVYREEFIHRARLHFLNLLDQVVKAAEVPLADLDIVTAEERLTLVREFNDNAADFPRDRSICHMAAQVAEKQPHRIAMEEGDLKITYGELNKRALRLSAHLREKGLKRDRLAAVLMERGVQMVVSIFAVWHAGGAYIPLDSANPKQRTLEILNDSEAAVLLTAPEHAEAYSPDMFSGEITLPGPWLDGADNQDTPTHSITPDMDSLAYVIYTSGSTGKPKGAMVEHIGMMNHIQVKLTDLQISEESIVVQNASHTFDISVWQYFSALVCGGKTLVYSNSLVLDVEIFLKRLVMDRVSILEVVPSYLSVLLSALEAPLHGEGAPLHGVETSSHSGGVGPLEYLLVTGETVKPNLVKRWFRAFPGIKMVNAYGPTEASDDITHHIMASYPGSERISIGKPLQNFNIYIVNRDMKLCPLGIKGEICVSGVGVGRGYLKDEEKTRRVFFEDPFVEEKGRRLYKTGDLGCWLPDGTIDFFGRIDYQVKIRGFRIELGEIENRLVEHPHIKEAVVTDREDAGGNKYLCAYTVSDETPDITQLKEYLSRSLPPYMIPAYFVPMESLPLGSSGKINRKALPAPELSEDPRQYVAPRNETEKALVEVWQEVLGVSRIGITDNFFDVGGDSIKAIQILSRLQKYKLKIKIRDLFQHPVLRDLGLYTLQTDRVFQQGVVEGDVPLTPIQQWFFDRGFSDAFHYNQALMLHRPEGFDENILRRVLTGLVTHHDALRMVFRRESETVRQYNRGPDDRLFQLDVVDITSAEDSNRQVAYEADRIQAGFDLETGPLLRLGLFNHTDGGHLLWVVHHLVMDGVSWRILIEDFTTAYRQALEAAPHGEGSDIQLPPKTDSFKYWSEKLYDHARGREIVAQIPYWKTIEETEAGRLPSDNDISPHENTIKNQDSLSIKLDKTATVTLQKGVNRAYNTEINDILLTALGLALHQWSGNNRFLINLEGHGREEIFEDVEISRTIGWFTSEFPVLLDMTQADNMGFTLKSVKESLRKIPQRGIGYGILRYLTPDEMKKDIRFRQEPEVSFNYMGRLDGGEDTKNALFSVSGLPVGATESPNMEVPFILTINSQILGGELELTVNYNRLQYHRATLERLLDNCRNALEDVIRHCSTKETNEITPSDVGYPELSFRELEDISVYIGSRVAADARIQRIYSLSPMQGGMLFHALMNSEATAYFEQSQLPISGRIDKELVEK
ncbi:MAG: amino acid adenylation domain-containing protein, partial [bacterium]|nr:amino acid adenylation domain-containing protein [bacterium]